MATELQRIYNSEINIRIGWFWDGGIDVRLGSSPRQKSQDSGTTGETFCPTELHQQFASVVGQAFSVSTALGFQMTCMSSLKSNFEVWPRASALTPIPAGRRNVPEV